MNSRRQFLAIGGAVLGLTPVVAWFARPQAVETEALPGAFPVEKSDAAWRDLLKPQQYRGVYQPAGRREAYRDVRLCSLRQRTLFVGYQVRQRHWLAELLAATGRCRRDVS